MGKVRTPAIEAAKRRNDLVWLDHVELSEGDADWLAPVERLTLWNVRIPAGFFAHLKKLWWLDIRGGSAPDLEVARGATGLQYLAINQVRGFADASVICMMQKLRFLDLYGLPKVVRLPSFSPLASLERVNLGQMRGLVSLRSLLEAPRLQELQLLKRVNINTEDADGIVNHPTIARFSWFAEDVPQKVYGPIIAKISLPSVAIRSPEDWFGLAMMPTGGMVTQDENP